MDMIYYPFSYPIKHGLKVWMYLMKSIFGMGWAGYQDKPLGVRIVE